jgi:hypothetical protein
MPEPIVPQPPMQRVHRRETPLTGAELAQARAQEVARLEWDEYYITAEQARAIPQAAMTPELLSRVKYSQRDWPENRMSLAQALGPLPAGGGETYMQQGMAANEMFWEPGADAKPPEHMLPGRRMERDPREQR